MILVTGANGFIGSHVVRALVKEGKEVRCFLRENANLINLEDDNLKDKLEFAYGDLRDLYSVKRAVKGARAVYHIAAYARLWYPNPKVVYEINWKGSKNIFQACFEEGVEKVVYTNTAAILRGGTKDKPSDEGAILGLNEMPGHYSRSKLLAYEEALKFVKMGLPIVIVSPTTPIGEGDYNLTPPGKMIVDFLNDKLPAYIETVINYIDVEDVAAGHILAEKRGRVGERYILGAYNLTLEEAFGVLNKITGKPAPKIKLAPAPLLPLGLLCEKISEFITHKEPPIPWEGLRLARRPLAFDSSKAIEELGLPQGDIESAFRKAADWFCSKGYVR